MALVTSDCDGMRPPSIDTNRVPCRFIRGYPNRHRLSRQGCAVGVADQGGRGARHVSRCGAPQHGL